MKKIMLQAASSLIPQSYKISLYKFCSKLISPDTVEALLALTILEKDYNKKLHSVKRFSKREHLWQNLLGDELKSKQIHYLEFGVWEGYSIHFFARLNSNSNSIFMGFDSFIGLPTDWCGNKAGTFSTSGNMPMIKDKRVSFIKGWFQNTLPENLKTLKEGPKDLIVHFDADLYSSTIYCLLELDKLKLTYLAIFDEFMGHETRAIYNYQQISGACVEFTGMTVSAKTNLPNQISCRIIPCKNYSSNM